MAKVLDYSILNSGPTPPEVKKFRNHVYEVQSELGRPVIFKHRWNLQDVQMGLTTMCPLHDESYERSKTDCPYCFGTGITGGWADGVVQFVIIADTPVDQLKIDKQGYILFDKHPEMTAPWFPDMGDGDLIILADFDHANWEVVTTHDRFELNEVKPTTIRGPYNQYTGYQFFKVQQTAKIDRIPNEHFWYTVPVEFDYSSVPVQNPPIGADPDNYPSNLVAASFGVRLTGSESHLTASHTQSICLTGGGTDASITSKVKLTGSNDSTIVIFE